MLVYNYIRWHLCRIEFGGLFNINAILGLIMAAIGVYIGVNLLPGLNTTVAAITTPTYSSGVAGLTSVVMIVFAAMIIFFVVSAMTKAA